MGIILLALVGLYLLVSLGVVIGAVAYARKAGKSPKRWGWSAALVMYLIPFWDWIPTVAVHQYYCATEAGFWVYKTPEQWKKENPGVMETLVANTGAPSRNEQVDDGHAKTKVFILNDRFNWIVTQQDFSNVLPIIRSEQKVTDTKTNEVLARYVDFGTGNSVKNTVGPPGPLKFWLHSGHCNRGGQNQDALRDFRNIFFGEQK
ncbi:MAG: hypothetical protein K8R10_14735 [Rhodocyclales bacterium]|jgi:hypothetical protein|nr:hypothetical protein [Rhodocyclales bacterium]